MNTTVYLSYSGRNCEAVLQVMEHLIYGGYGMVCDCLLPAHEPFDTRCSRAIGQASLVVAVITVDAPQCEYMEQELRLAAESKTTILPVLAGEAELPLQYREILGETAFCRVSEYPTKQEMAAVMAAVAEYMQ